MLNCIRDCVEIRFMGQGCIKRKQKRWMLEAIASQAASVEEQSKLVTLKTLHQNWIWENISQYRGLGGNGWDGGNIIVNTSKWRYSSYPNNPSPILCKLKFACSLSQIWLKYPKTWYVYQFLFLHMLPDQLHLSILFLMEYFQHLPLLKNIFVCV